MLNARPIAHLTLILYSWSRGCCLWLSFCFEAEVFILTYLGYSTLEMYKADVHSYYGLEHRCVRLRYLMAYQMAWRLRLNSVVSLRKWPGDHYALAAWMMEPSRNPYGSNAINVSSNRSFGLLNSPSAPYTHTWSFSQEQIHTAIEVVPWAPPGWD